MAGASKMTTRGELFWNAYGNLQADVKPGNGYDFNRELLTHIQADERYISYVDEYLNTAQNLTEPKEDIHARALAEHEKSVNALETGTGYSADVQGLANDFFFVIDQDYGRAVTVAPGEYTPQQRINDTFSFIRNASAVAAEKPVDEEFAKTQLGDLAQTPKAEAAPTTTSIKPEDMPAPAVREVEPAAGEDTPAPAPATAENKPAEAAAEPEKAAPETENTAKTEDVTSAAEYAEHIVVRGESLWKLAKEYYGLEKAAEIQRTVDYLASVNGLGEGTAANHIKVGQTIKLPDSPVVPEDTPRLNWQALDAETKRGHLGKKFAAAVNNELPETQQPDRVADIAPAGPAMTPV